MSLYGKPIREGLTTRYEEENDSLTESQLIHNYHQAIRTDASKSYWLNQALNLEQYRQRQKSIE